MNREKIMLNQIERLIIRTLRDFLQSMEIQNNGSIDKDTVIYGPDGLLDSIGLVTLITDLEETIEEEFDVSIILADERAMSQTKSPFGNISLLARYINSQVQNEY